MSKHPSAKGIVLEADIKLNFTDLKVKLIVFQNFRAMKKCWDRVLREEGLACCKGAVNPLHTLQIIPEGKTSKEKRFIAVDPRYVCVMGLLQKHLRMEIICHEAVHAGYAFSGRAKRVWWADMKKSLDQEEVAYPTGIIAAEILKALKKQSLEVKP